MRYELANDEWATIRPMLPTSLKTCRGWAIGVS